MTEELLSPFTGEEIEAQKSPETCPKAQSWHDEPEWNPISLNLALAFSCLIFLFFRPQSLPSPNFFHKRPNSEYFLLRGPVSDATTPLCHCRAKPATGGTQMDECNCVPVQPYPKKQAMGLTWPVHPRWLTPELGHQPRAFSINTPIPFTTPAPTRPIPGDIESRWFWLSCGLTQVDYCEVTEVSAT